MLAQCGVCRFGSGLDRERVLFVLEVLDELLVVVANTLGLIVVTGILGASLARRQGLGILRSVQAELAAGRLPASALVDGVIVLLAGAVLMTPGVLTDMLGFLCLIPGTRKWIKARLWSWLKRAAMDGRVKVSVSIGDYTRQDPEHPPDPGKPEGFLDP